MTAATLLSPAELKQQLLDVGYERYHHKHPFHRLMHEGTLSREQLQAWALNRYYYQSRIPVKDSIILSRAPDAGFRRAWLKRVLDHDGTRHRSRRNRKVDPARRSYRSRPRDSRLRTQGSPRRPLRRRCLSPTGFARYISGGSRFFVDRTLLSRPDLASHRCSPPALPLASNQD